MKRTTRIWLILFCGILCVLGSAGRFPSNVVYAQQDSNDYSDGNFYIFSSIDVDSSYYLFTDSYMEVEFDEYEDIDSIELDVSADEDGGQIGGDSAYGDDDEAAVIELKSKSPVSTGHEYGVQSDGYACYDDGEGDDDCEYVGTAYASINVGTPLPQIASISPSSVQQGDQGTLTIKGTNLVENSADQITLNYSGQGMPFELTGTPSSTQATFSYDVSGYDTGTYQISITNNEGTSNQVNFTINPPQNACSQSQTQNSFTLQISGLNVQGGTFTVSHPTDAKSDAATTVSYGSASTSQSVASSLAANITRKYIYYGITARANDANVVVQSTALFGAVSANSSGSTVNVGTPSAVSCVVIPHIPLCWGAYPDYDYSRSPYSDGSTTPRQHIINKHILGTPSAGDEPNTVYENPGGFSTEDMFILVKGYNFTTVVENPIRHNGYFSHTFTEVTQNTVFGSMEKGWIGIDAEGNHLHTNKLFLSPDRCRAITSYPIAP